MEVILAVNMTTAAATVYFHYEERQLIRRWLRGQLSYAEIRKYRRRILDYIGVVPRVKQKSA